MADTVAKTTDEQKVKINEKKWSKPLWSAGWSGIPNIIIERQEALGLDPIDMNIILHLTQYWWRADNPPSPSVGTIAKALKLGVRTIQKHIKCLEDAKLIERVERRDGPYGSQTNLYKLDGLIAAARPAKEDPAAALAVLQEIRDTTGQTRTEGAQGYLNPRDANPDDAETHDMPGDEVTSETMVEPAQDGLDEVWPEVLHQIRPSERDICRGVGLD